MWKRCKAWVKRRANSVKNWFKKQEWGMLIPVLLAGLTWLGAIILAIVDGYALIPIGIWLLADGSMHESAKKLGAPVRHSLQNLNTR